MFLFLNQTGNSVFMHLWDFYLFVGIRLKCLSLSRRSTVLLRFVSFNDAALGVP